MLKSYAMACLMATALAAAPAFAQTSPAPAGSPGGQPAAGGQAGPANIQFITESRPDLWRASQLERVDVYNDRNEKIGDINEVLVDRQGKVEAVVIGVGGFLGIGDRNVAVPFNALRWEMPDPNTAGAGYGTGGPAATGATGTGAGGTAASVGGTAGGGAGTAGTTAGGAGGGGATTDQNRNAPARAVLAGVTRDQLQQAPEFRSSR